MASGYSGYVGLAIFESAGLDGLGGASLLEGSAEQSAPSATAAASTPPLTTTSPSTLLFAGFADQNGTGTPSAGDGWTHLVTNTNFYMIAEARTVSLTGKYAATATLPSTDDQWVGLVAAFAGRADLGKRGGWGPALRIKCTPCRRSYARPRLSASRPLCSAAAARSS